MGGNHMRSRSALLLLALAITKSALAVNAPVADAASACVKGIIPKNLCAISECALYENRFPPWPRLGQERILGPPTGSKFCRFGCGARSGFTALGCGLTGHNIGHRDGDDQSKRTVRPRSWKFDVVQERLFRIFSVPKAKRECFPQ